MAKRKHSYKRARYKRYVSKRSRGATTSLKGMVRARSFKEMPMLVKAGAVGSGLVLLGMPHGVYTEPIINVLTEPGTPLGQKLASALRKSSYAIQDLKTWYPLLGSVGLVWLAKKV